MGEHAEVRLCSWPNFDQCSGAFLRTFGAPRDRLALRGESLRNAAEAGIRAVLVNYMKPHEGKRYNAAVLPPFCVSQCLRE